MFQSPSKTQPETEALQQRAARYFSSGETAAALALLRQILSLAPGDHRTRYALAVAQLRSGDPAAALADFETLLDELPEHDGAAFGRGLALFALGQRQSALSVFRHQTKSGPLAARAWASIADITAHEPERIHAIGAAAKALTDVSARSGTLAERRAAAAALIAARRPAEAEAMLMHLHGPVSGAPLPDRLLARALCHQGRFEEAFTEACRLLANTKAEDVSARQPGEFDPGTAKDVLAEILCLLTSSGARAFLAAGTLLGFHRHGAPLAHDRDIDIGVLRTSGGGPDIATILRAHDRILLPRISRPGDRYFGIEHRGIAVDIFLYDATGDHLTCGFSDLPGDIQWRFRGFGISELPCAGRRWPVPEMPERYLSETYGPGWEIPDKGFASVVSSPALYRTDPHARAYYAALRARTALIAGDTSKARSLVRQSPVPIPAFPAGEEADPDCPRA